MESWNHYICFPRQTWNPFDTRWPNVLGTHLDFLCMISMFPNFLSLKYLLSGVGDAWSIDEEFNIIHWWWYLQGLAVTNSVYAKRTTSVLASLPGYWEEGCLTALSGLRCAAVLGQQWYRAWAAVERWGPAGSDQSAGWYTSKSYLITTQMYILVSLSILWYSLS